MISGDRVKLAPAAKSLFPDLAQREGIVDAIDGWPLISWQGLDAQTRIDPIFLEVVTND